MSYFAYMNQNVSFNRLVLVLTVGNSIVNLHICKLERGYLAICPAGEGYIISAFGTNVECGLLRSRIEKLSQYFSNVLEQLK